MLKLFYRSTCYIAVGILYAHYYTSNGDARGFVLTVTSEAILQSVPEYLAEGNADLGHQALQKSRV